MKCSLCKTKEVPLGHNFCPNLECKWEELAKIIRKRDFNKCFKCSYTNTDIPVHHIIPRKYIEKYPWILTKFRFNSADDPDNLICLCPSDHKTTENNFLNLGVTAYVKNMINCAHFRNLRDGIKCR
jgi:hypothetical protein